MTAVSTTEKVTVTAGHIKRGERRDPDSCPIALAIRDMHPGAWTADVYSDFAMLTASRHAEPLTASLPAEAVDFVHIFDGGGDVAPFEFEVTWRTAEVVPEVAW